MKTLKPSDPDKLIKKHQALTHSDAVKVISHIQRDKAEWVLNTIMIENCEVPFKYKRKQQYQSLKGARVNMTYYATIEVVAGLDFEIMNVVRIKKS
jgi:hypothetical protein